MESNRPISVAIRGAGGLLGHRLARAIMQTQDDMRLDAVILGTDQESFRRLQSACRALKHPPNFRIFIDAKQREVRRLMAAWASKWEFEPLDQSYNVLQKTDAIIDAAIVPGKDALAAFYEQYSRKKPIIHQSGRYPKYTTVAPPFDPNTTEDDCNFRQGDCLISGIAPVVFPFRNDMEEMQLRLLVQRQKPLHGPTIEEKIVDILIDTNLQRQIHANVAELLPTVEPDMIDVSVMQAPMHVYYMCEFSVTFRQAKSADEIITTLRNQPRIAIAPPEISLSTGNLKQYLQEPYEANGTPLEPIVLFTGRDAIEIRGRRAKFRIAIYSRAITMLPNIDTVRGLVRGQALLNAMQITDEKFGFHSEEEQNRNYCQ